jgi:hypothetical protein
MSSEIQLYEKLVDPIQAIERLGSMMAKSGLSGAEKTETGMMLAWACLAERKSPFDIFRTYHLVEGKLAMRADAMLAGFRGRGGKVRWKQFDAIAAIGIFTFEGVDTEIGFTMEDAKRMEVIRPRSGWTKNPDAMLRARCIAKAVRMICPEVIAGYLAVEEIGDGDDAPPQREIVLSGSSPAAPSTGAETPAAPKRGRPAKTAEQAPVIEVPSEKVPEAPNQEPANENKPTETKAGEPPPVAPTAPVTPDAPGRFIAQPGKNRVGISNETVEHLMGIFGDREAAAFKFITAKGESWIKGSTLSGLKVEKAQLIIDKTPKFMELIGAK